MKKANEQLQKTCGLFVNVRLVDLSKIGSRFHTRQSLHLNKLSKMYIVNNVLHFLSSIRTGVALPEQPIAMGRKDSFWARHWSRKKLY